MIFDIRFTLPIMPGEHFGEREVWSACVVPPGQGNVERMVVVTAGTAFLLSGCSPTWSLSLSLSLFFFPHLQIAGGYFTLTAHLNSHFRRSGATCG